MQIDIVLTHDPIARPQAWPVPHSLETGSVVEFYGIVRETEDAAKIPALTYEAYAAMADKIMRQKIAQLQKEHPCQVIRIVHRLGIIPAGRKRHLCRYPIPPPPRRLPFSATLHGRIQKRCPHLETEMTSVAKAQEMIEQHTATLPAESLPLAALQGRILREPVAAAEDMPAFDRSAMDGYAIRADDPATDFAIVAEIRAGDALDRELQAGQTIRIFTGARLPGAGLRVVMQEHVEAQGNRMRITKHIPATNIRRRGEDARAGEVLLQPGTTLDATAIALLASIGKTSALVSAQPRILHLTTGDEIIAPDQIPRRRPDSQQQRFPHRRPLPRVGRRNHRPLPYERQSRVDEGTFILQQGGVLRSYPYLRWLRERSLRFYRRTFSASSGHDPFSRGQCPPWKAANFWNGVPNGPSFQEG